MTSGHRARDIIIGGNNSNATEQMLEQSRGWCVLKIDLSKAYTLIESQSLQLSKASHHCVYTGSKTTTIPISNTKILPEDRDSG